MNLFNNSELIASVVAIAAIISPIFVALINNLFNFKIRKLDLKHETAKRNQEVFYFDKKRTYEEFLKVAGDFPMFRDNTDAGISCLQKVSTAAMLYSSKEIGNKIDEFYNRAVILRENRGNADAEYHKQLSELTVLLTAELKSVNDNVSRRKRSNQ